MVKEKLTRQNLSIHQSQRQTLSLQMQKALHVLQLPVLELSSLIEEEVEENPLLEYFEGEFLSSDHFRHSDQGKEENDIRQFIENTVSCELSLHSQLLKQAHERFSNEKERRLAEIIIGNLDEWGFLSLPLEEIALSEAIKVEELKSIIPVIQTFEPLGIAAKNLQESLLIQLKMKGKLNSLAYQIVENHYDHLLKNHLGEIAKKMHLSPQEIRKIVENEIVLLNLHPGTSLAHSHYKDMIHFITPDILIERKGETLSIEIYQEKIPKVRFIPKYLSLIEDKAVSQETKDYIKEKWQKGQWLLKTLDDRNKTLYRIAEEIVKKQKAFFLLPDGKLKGFMMKDIASSLSLHESTIVRAVSNKYLSSPRGIFPLRFFFTHGFSENEEMSSHTIKQLVKEIIENEDRKKPLSDEAISLLLKEKGFPCARRTVAKYRSSLKIAGTSQRKQF